MRNDITARGGYVVAPSDTVELNPMPMRLKITAAGNLSLVTEDGSLLPSFPVNVGDVIEMRVRRVLAISTASCQAWY